MKEIIAKMVLSAVLGITMVSTGSVVVKSGVLAGNTHEQAEITAQADNIAAAASISDPEEKKLEQKVVVSSPSLLAKAESKPAPILPASNTSVAVSATASAPLALAAKDSSRCLITISGNQYDVTTFRTRHGGGDIFNCGTDMTAAYHSAHGNNLGPISGLLASASGAATVSNSLISSQGGDLDDWEMEDDEGEDD